MRRALLLPAFFLGMVFNHLYAQKIESHLYDHDTLIYDVDSNLYKVENLGDAINSAHVESGPRISPDGKALYFFRIDTTGVNKHKTQAYTSDVFVSYFNDADSTWSEAEDLGSPINTKHGSNSVQAVVNDGDKLILGNVYMKNGLSKAGVSQSIRRGDSWSFPEEIKIKGLKNEGRFSVHMTNDEKVIFLSLQNKESVGGLDLYVSFLEEDGKHYSHPLDLGPVVNSPGNEATAFLAADGKTLYFSSNGHRGRIGGYDIFKTERKDSTWTSWTAPVNIGKPYNTADDEFYFSVPDKGDYAYMTHHFTTSDGVEHSDIVRVKMTEKPTFALTGKVYDKISGKMITATITLEEVGGSVSSSDKTTDSTGYALSDLPVRKKYKYTVSAPNYIPETGEIDLSAVGAKTEKEMDFFLAPDPKLNLTAFIYDKDTGKKIEGHIVLKQLPNTPMGDALADTTNGYQKTLKPGKYEFEVHAEGYITSIETMDIEDLIVVKDSIMEIRLKPWEVVSFDIENIFFESGKANLLPESFPELDKLVRVLKDAPDIKVEIAGHTDNVGSESSNERLSQNRAQAVVNYLGQHGIDQKLFHAKGYGETSPRATNATKEGRASNRRVEFKVLEVGNGVKIHKEEGNADYNVEK